MIICPVCRRKISDSENLLLAKEPCFACKSKIAQKDAFVKLGCSEYYKEVVR